MMCLAGRKKLQLIRKKWESIFILLVMSASNFLGLQIEVGLYLRMPELHTRAIIPC